MSEVKVAILEEQMKNMREDFNKFEYRIDWKFEDMKTFISASFESLDNKYAKKEIESTVKRQWILLKTSVSVLISILLILIGIFLKILFKV